MKLSKHFTLEEMTRSATARRLQIDNQPDEQQVRNLQALCENVLEPLREAMGTAVRISSGYRSPQLNRAVGGSRGSQHLKGEAADIIVPDADTGNRWLLWIMDNCRFDQLIKERETRNSKTFWIHVSYREGHCRQEVIINLIKKK